MTTHQQQQHQQQPTMGLMDADNLDLWGAVEDARFKDSASAAASSSPSSSAGAAASAAALASAFPLLYAAVDSGDRGEVERVLSLLAPLSGKGEAGRRLLHMAGGPEGLSPLARAGQKGDALMVRALGGLGGGGFGGRGAATAPFLDEPSPLTGLTPLAAAASTPNARPAVFEALLEIGCDANGRLGPALTGGEGGGGGGAYRLSFSATRGIGGGGGHCPARGRQDDQGHTERARWRV
jgi:hypothetical protein